MLQGKRILITGASRGIGYATVERCIHAGASVIANYKSDKGELRNLEMEYQNLVTIKADIREESDVDRIMECVKCNFGSLDGIVNNAGIISRTPNWKYIQKEDWYANFDTNVFGTWNVIRKGVEVMDKGSIVNVSSIYGVFPEGDELAYSVSKSGVDALTYALAKKLSPSIRVNSIAPGNTLTSMVPDIEKMHEIENKTLLKRSASPYEIADVVVFLMSDSSQYLTGCIIPVDGGYHII